MIDVQILHPKKIRTDGGTQMRAELDATVIDGYAQDLQAGARFPPLIVYYDGENYWLGDGFHRLAARKKLFEGAIECEVRSGTRRDAVLCAAGANAAHGLRRNNADKRRAVETLLRDEEWRKWSDREIARRCAVGNNMVSEMRKSSLSSDDSEDNGRTYTTKHGTVATMQTANIGRVTTPAEPPRREFQATIAAEPMPEPAKPHVTNNSGNNEWYTPAPYIEAAWRVLDAIDLDPASCAAANEVVKAAYYYDIDSDGLRQPWAGRIWLNPPYAGDLVGRFINKLIKHVETDEVTSAIVLVNNATETAWFQDLAGIASGICFPKGRIRYWHPDRPDSLSPLQGQAIAYVGRNPYLFRTVFADFGVTL